MNWQDHIVEDGQDVRLDRYLKRLFPSITQGVIEKSVRKKDIKVNGKKASTSTRLNNNDIISYFAAAICDTDEYNYGQYKHYSNSVIALAKKIIGEYLIYESEELIAINKPHGLAVQGGSKVSISVDHAIQYLNDSQGASYKLVHRLDKATSGILLIAKGYQNAMKLTVAFKDKLIEKVYVAQLSGVLKKSSGIIDNYIGKASVESSAENSSDSKEIMCVVSEAEGKRAITRYRVLEVDEAFGTSLVEFYPETGRTHQLRVHSKYLGAPIVGDQKYGGPKAKRMMLHAKKLTIPQEIFGKEIVMKLNQKTFR